MTSSKVQDFARFLQAKQVFSRDRETSGRQDVV